MDDEDAFLYGDAGSAEIVGPRAAPTARAATPPKANGATQDLSVDMDASDSDDDELEIIVDVDPSKPSMPTFDPRRQLNNRVLQASPIPSLTSAVPVRPLPITTLVKAAPEVRPTSPPIPFPSTQAVAPAFDPNLPAVLEDNTSLFDVDIDALDNKPWRVAGAHVADYFNYGFDEQSWKVYVARQRAMRNERISDRERPFRVFADLPVQEAWQTLPPELKGMLMNAIMSSMGPSGMNPMAMMMGGMMPPGMPGPPPNMLGPPPGMMSGPGPMLQQQQQQNHFDGPHDNGWGERGSRRPTGEENEEGPGDENSYWGPPEGMDLSMVNMPMVGGMGRGRGRGGNMAPNLGRAAKGGNPFGVIPASVLARGQSGPPGPSGGTNRESSADPAPPSQSGRPHSPLPANIPTGPRRAPPGPLPTGPRSERDRRHYKDKDAGGGSQGPDLDYEERGGRAGGGGGRRTSARESGKRRREYSSDEDDRYRRKRSRSRSRSRSYDSRD